MKLYGYRFLARLLTKYTRSDGFRMGLNYLP